MTNKKRLAVLVASFACVSSAGAQDAASRASNPILWADVPDISVLRVGDAYYMSSTTMHLSPGLPIMKSKDLVNWELVGYAYDTLIDNDAMNLANGKNTYGAGSWASSLRCHDGTFYATTFSSTADKTHVYSTRDIEKGPWKAAAFGPMLHDHSLFFDDDRRVYMIHGGGNLRLTELEPDVSGVKPGGVDKLIVENAGQVAGGTIGLNAEGSQVWKHDGKYYLFNITWPQGDMRTEIVHRADKIEGPYEGRVVLKDQGIAQGGIVDTPDGKWWGYMFQDHGAVGRIPFLVPMKWENGWPVMGVDGRVPATLDLPAARPITETNLVASDDFSRKAGDRPLPLAWQWNHNPDNAHWSLDARPGWLRLTTGRVDADLLAARNTLTQRTFGPACSATVSLDVSRLRDGDVAGLVALQKRYGLVGVKQTGDKRSVVVISAESDTQVRLASIPLEQATVWLRIDCNFKDKADTATFAYSLDGEKFTPVGKPLHMTYTLPHFMGYRFGLCAYATKVPGGSADFDFYRVGTSSSGAAGR